ncbi:MAG: hypothetical protein GWN84_18380 [Gammaproteobacteria bacterium]|nr:hypothetical protein [Gammaproteobacteria bacterium]NIR84800.1 hypothetical protein [Gammaproteobacteria bacterium]NIR91514.1 hypothetical protein [Gammaproteobacteria bacterium]NIU05847.1 hypothetical protein [Gammaproteobacteria bacterium]NIV76702.1 hypothetical protein [Gammaproteobacteria bacterium]
MQLGLRGFLRDIGTLRTVLLAGVLVVAATAPFAGGAVRYSGWGMYPTLIAPTLAVMLFFVLALDILMTTVFMHEHQGPERRRYRSILRGEGLVLVLLLLSWLPFFVRLLRI